MNVECPGCAIPIVFEDTADTSDEVTCTACDARVSWGIQPGLFDEAGGPHIDVVRWWCKHGVVDYQRCKACENYYP